jgi:hypothetical protein
VLFPRLPNSWTSNPYPRARPKRRRGRRKRKPPNCKTQSSLPTDSLPSPWDPNTCLEEMVSRQLVRHLQRPQTLHQPRGLDLPGSRRRLSRVKMAEVVPGPHSRMVWTVGRRLRSDSGRRGKQGTSTRILHLPKGGSVRLNTSISAMTLRFLHDMAICTMNVPNIAPYLGG